MLSVASYLKQRGLKQSQCRLRAFTLVEMLVSILLMSCVMLVAVQLFTLFLFKMAENTAARDLELRQEAVSNEISYYFRMAKQVNVYADRYQYGQEDHEKVSPHTNGQFAEIIGQNGESKWIEFRINKDGFGQLLLFRKELYTEQEVDGEKEKEVLVAQDSPRTAKEPSQDGGPDKLLGVCYFGEKAIQRLEKDDNGLILNFPHVHWKVSEGNNIYEFYACGRGVEIK